ncbi:CDP-glycerol glycerophosphotransferase family protein [Terrilactibacillus laevilacticus]|uniref:CDP-glycerol glycerophosphotransferase family protein n=1 Tax=Terrilactibacillus laevilacticus TaxID=1380157 RepID=A0ABW5PQA8_9BACI|nr:CDP-glycerol glycerophosphotransferase family protein [Terrilactibacillus laevilacticus]
MIREYIVTLYLFVFKILFTLCKIINLRNKVTFVISYSENNLYVYEEIMRQNLNCKVVFQCKGKCINDFKQTNEKVIQFETINPIHLFQSAYHLATSKVIFVDNYFGFLASIHFKKQVECIQLWHAAGAIKTFGLKDQSIWQRSKKARKRFTQVYQKFDKVVVGSNEMAEIFKKAFGVSERNILRTGIPRTDFFYEETKKRRVVNYFKNIFGSKKVILYAPTFRDGRHENIYQDIDLKLMREKLEAEYVLLLRLHPSIQSKMMYDLKYDGFVYDYSSWPNINELLLITNILITDYSSIPYEFSQLLRPIIFFPYDLEEYQLRRGLWDDYDKLVPGPVVKTTEGIIECIQNENYNLDHIKNFSKQWNMYSTGISSQNIVNYIKNRLG